MDQDKPSVESGQTSYNKGRSTTVYWLYAAIIAYAISFLVTNSFGVYVVIKGHQVNNSLCRVTAINRDTIARILDKVRENSLESADSPDVRNIIREQFNELLALVPPVDCQ